METSPLGSVCPDFSLGLGIGAKPIIAGYESQLIEYAAGKSEGYQQIRDDVVCSILPRQCGVLPCDDRWMRREASFSGGTAGSEDSADCSGKATGFRTETLTLPDAAALSVNGVTEAVTRVTGCRYDDEAYLIPLGSI